MKKFILKVIYLIPVLILLVYAVLYIPIFSHITENYETPKVTDEVIYTTAGYTNNIINKLNLGVIVISIFLKVLLKIIFKKCKINIDKKFDKESNIAIIILCIIICLQNILFQWS